MDEPTPPPSLDVATFPLRPSPLVRRSIFVLGCVIFVIGALGVTFAFGRGDVLIGLAIGGGLGLWVALRLAKTPSELPPLRIDRTGLCLPRSLHSPREESVPFAAIRSVGLYGGGRGGGVVVVGAGRAFNFPFGAFVDPRDAERFVASARAALAAHHPEVLRDVERQDELSVAMQRVVPHATYLFLAIIALAFLLTLALGGATSPVLLRLGANAPGLVRDGQWFRLFTGNFLHGGWIHIYLNALALFTLGASVERLFGTSRYLVVFLLSALGGGVASALSGTHVLSVGISTALFGLLGAWGFAAWRLRAHLPVGFQRTRRWWIVQLGINGALSALPIVDWAGHLGGFLAGAATTAVLLGHAKGFGGLPRGSLVVKVAGALVLAFTAAGAVDARYAIGRGTSGATLARAVMGMPRAAPEALNSVAWEQAKDLSADAAAIALAREAIDRAMRDKPGDFEYLDTSATIHHREGDDEAAVRQECDALRLERAARPDCGDCKERHVFETQLARFLHARGGSAARSHALPSEEPLDASWLPTGLRLVAPPSGPRGLHAYVWIAGPAPALLELDGLVPSPAIELSSRSLPVATPSHPPVFACVAWRESGPPGVAVKVLPLDPTVLGMP